MEKKLVMLVIPCMEEEFELLIPGFLTVREVIALLVDAIPDITQNIYVPSGMECLCRRNPEMVLDPDHTLAEQNLQNGERLYLL